MELRYLLNQTDMIFHRYDGIVSDHGDYISVESPGHPSYFWGNYLIFNHPPGEGDAVTWRRIFRERFGKNPAIRHEAFTWESDAESTCTNASLEAFAERGFQLHRLVTLAARTLVEPAKTDPAVLIRPLDGQADWERALENQVLIHAQEFGDILYREFRAKQNARYRNMISEGLGNWFGAFVEGKLVGDLGLFRHGDLGRFQMVGTHPGFRRRGICGRLLYCAGRYGLENMGLRTLVIAADDTYFAKEIYRSVGFEVHEHTSGLELRPTTWLGPC